MENSEKYEELPSSAIEYLELGFDDNSVKIIFKSNLQKQYSYKCEDLDEFQSSFMQLCGKLEAEQDRDEDDNLVEDVSDTIEREDVSIGKFINQRIALGNLKLDYYLTMTDDMTEQGWEPFEGSTLPNDGVIVNVPVE